MTSAFTQFMMNYLGFFAGLLFVAGLIALYFLGVWSRNYLFPADAKQPFKRQLIAALPVGLITMAVYAKSALPTINNSETGAFDAVLIVGYAIVYGMLSRETLDKLLGAASRAAPPAP